MKKATNRTRKGRRASALNVVARPNAPYSTEQIREAYAVLTDMAGGPNWPIALTPRMVLDQVLEDDDHPLRKFLEPDVKRAAYGFWLAQIRTLMTEVRVSVIIERGKPREVYARVLFPVPMTDKHERGYRPLHELVKEERTVGVLARTRISYLRQWAGATQNLIVSIESPAEARALRGVFDGVMTLMERFDSEMRGIEQAAE